MSGTAGGTAPVMGHLQTGYAQQALQRAKTLAQRAQYLRGVIQTEAIQLLLAEGATQREVARELGISKSKVNRAAKATVAYAINPDTDTELDDLMVRTAWGSEDEARAVHETVVKHATLAAAEDRAS